MDFTLTTNSFYRHVNDFMQKLYNIDYKGINVLDKDFPFELANKFRTAYNIKTNNYLATNSKGYLAFDLMACPNPYANVRKQYNFVKFNLREHILQEEIMGNVYAYYNMHPEYNIDLFIQTCYAIPQDYPSHYADRLEGIINKGFCIRFIDDDHDFYLTPTGVGYSFGIPGELLNKMYKVVNSPVIQALISNEIASMEGKSSLDDIINHCRDIDVAKFMACIEDCLSQEFTYDGNVQSLQENIKSLLDVELNNYNIIRICVLNLLLNPNLKYLYFIPLLYPNQLNIGAITLFAEQQLTDKEIYEFKALANSIISPYVQACINCSHTRKITIESIKSAKAAIMSRNMSHNLGSHVMFYIKQKLQSVSKIINNDVLHNIITGSQLNIEELQEKLQNSANIELPFLVGLGRFINYLQERQDYIATVATNYIPARSTISFKDFIYDELKPDLRYERHKRNDSSSDNGWQPKNLLLDYIAYSEGYSKSDAIEIKFGEFDGHNPQDDTAKGDFQALRKFNVAVPGGVIGRQAIFSIVENIIRNAAKHSEHCPDGKLVLQLSLVDAEKDFAAGRFEPEKFRCMRKEKGSMESGESLVKLYQNHKDTFHILRIKLDMPNKEDDIEALVGKLGEDYVEEDGSMKETSKGLKEMRISAAWLRGHSIDTAIPTTEPPVLAVYSEPYRKDKDKETISYYLCIPKPCKVAFVVEDMAKYTALNDEIKPFGCQIFEYVEQNEKNQDNKEAVQTFRNQIADYEIVCMNLEKDKVDRILPYISSRDITKGETTESILERLNEIVSQASNNNEGENNEASKKDDNNANNAKEAQYAQIKVAIDSIYEKWFEETYGKVNNKLLIVDDNAYGKHKKQSNNEGNASSTIDKVECLAVGTAEEENCKDAVIYSTHFAGLYKEYTGKKDDNKVKSGYEKLQLGACIEPITGNNSTDRLIRQDEWTTEWKYKHLSAGLARVAVFDERIFGSFITSSKGNYTIKYKDIFDTIKKHIDTPMPEDDFVAVMQRIGLTEDDSYRIWEDMSDQNINETLGRYYEVEYNGQVAQKNYERRIWAFDIQADKHSANTIKILGYAAMIDANPDWADENIKKPPIKVATLTIDNGKYEVRLSKDGENIFPDGNSQIFDYITIHQGILDKIYNAFGIKEDTEENRKKKHEVTNALHRCFSRYNVIPKEATAFLPNLIIHSGRSKPNEQDMPQHQPFVQFAAVDHAVKDCKYTLVELLATAHYEKGGNNN